MGSADGSIIATIITAHMPSISSACVGDQAAVIGIAQGDPMSCWAEARPATDDTEASTAADTAESAESGEEAGSGEEADPNARTAVWDRPARRVIEPQRELPEPPDTQGACARVCTPRWNACISRCDDRPESCREACETEHRTCMRGCF